MRRTGAARRSKGLNWWKIVLFAGCFAVVFGACQRVLVPKHEPNQKLTELYKSYANLPSDTLDVVFFGSSKFDHGISPNVMWNEQGIAAYNLSASAQQYAFSEQKLLMALEENTAPKYAVFVPGALYQNRKYSAETLIAYLKMTKALPRLHQRTRAISALWSELKRQQNEMGILDMFFPFFLFHSRWSQLGEKDFLPVGMFSRINPDYCLGQSIYPKMQDVTENYQNPFYLSNKELSPEAKETWTRVFQRCYQEGIQPVVVFPPCFSRVPNDILCRLGNEFYEACGVLVFDYNTEAEMIRMNWNLQRDFSNDDHLNLRGAAKLSADLAQKLSQLPGIEDHRGDERFAVWDEYCDTYYSSFQEELTYALGEEGARRYNQ